MIAKVGFDALLGDKAFDIDWIRAELNDRLALAVIPPKADRKPPIPCGRVMSRWRHLIENFSRNLKEFRRITTRYDKTDISFSAMIHLAASYLALK